MRKRIIVGTSVRERKYEVSIAKTTAIASGHEERLGRAGDEDDRHEDDADAERGDERRRRDLRRAVEDGAHDRLLLRHVAVDVLDLDRRVVDEDADGERHPAERHDVERLAEPRQDDDRHEDRERDRDERR